MRKKLCPRGRGEFQHREKECAAGLKQKKVKKEEWEKKEKIQLGLSVTVWKKTPLGVEFFSF